MLKQTEVAVAQSNEFISTRIFTPSHVVRAIKTIILFLVIYAEPAYAKTIGYIFIQGNPIISFTNASSPTANGTETAD
jgi:hypothetical protein